MFKNYIKVAFRNLLKHKSFSFINIFGLSMGMAVTMMIGLWVWDELSFDQYHTNYPRIAQVWQLATDGKETGAFTSTPLPLAPELRLSYPADLKYVVRAGGGSYTIAAGDNKFTQRGCFIEPDGPEMFSFHMLQGTRNGLKDPTSILLSRSLAQKLFGKEDPVGKFVKITNILSLKVAGIYEDLPENSTWSGMAFFAPWDKYVSTWDWVKNLKDDWGSNITDTYVQIADHADMDKVSAKISSVMTRKHPEKNIKVNLFLHPMRKWHLYSNFVDGVNEGGLITFVWLFGIIGTFVLLLACINFMNLSTARSEKRAKEVGIRKAIGSLRTQLVSQFYSESVLMSLFAFVLAIIFVITMLPWFNTVADKHIIFPWTNAWCWIAGIGFSLLTGFIAGSYPAIYLSSFQPVKVLKGTFRAGRFASLPRKVLVVVQFTVSVLLITGTVIVYRQIQYAKNRPVGYDRQGLISIRETTPEVYKNYDIIRRTLLENNVITEMAESQCPITDIWAGAGGFEWAGKDPSFEAGFANIPVRHEFGEVVNWKFKEGRDFSKAFASDSMALILNEAAVKYMNLKTDPVGMTIHWNDKDYHVIGVTEDMIMTSPYRAVPPSIFGILHEGGNIINIRLNPRMNMSEALKKLEAVFKQYNSSAPFEYTFVDQEYAKKFGAEERIATLSTVFAALAIVISCLGLFGLASFIAEQRTKEIGIRKVLGASIFNLWRMLSKDFALLVVLSSCIATPIAWYFLHQWLQQYEYRTNISWIIFLAVGAGALFIALSTVSYQAIKTALANPVKSLRAE